MVEVKLLKAETPKKAVARRRDPALLCFHFAREDIILAIFFPFDALCPGKLTFESLLRT